MHISIIHLWITFLHGTYICYNQTMDDYYGILAALALLALMGFITYAIMY